MKKIRIGNDFVFNWAIERGGLPEDLSSVLEKHLHLSVFGKRVELVEGVDYDITGNVIRIEVTPAIANIIGTYKAEFHYILPDNGLIDEDRKCAVDVDAFQIVAKTAQADDSSEFSMTSDMAIAFKGDKGDSAYQVWLDAGNTGTEEDYFAYLRQPAIDAGASISELEGEIQVNEGLRVSAESERDLREATRIQAESERSSAEAIRQSNEGDRIENEATRVQNEAERISKENVRQSNEIDRVEAESERVQAEIERVQAEIERQNTIQEAVTATNLANEKANLANTAAQNANEAALEAQTATQEATTASSLADTARLAIQDDLALKANHGYSEGETPKTLKQVEDNASGLIARYVHSQNLECFITSYDSTTGTFYTESNPFVNGAKVGVTLNSLFDASPRASLYTPTGLATGGTAIWYIINATSTSFQLAASVGGEANIFENNPTQDLSKWKFEHPFARGVTISNINRDRIRIVIEMARVSNNITTMMLINGSTYKGIDVASATSSYSTISIPTRRSSYGLVDIEILINGNSSVLKMESNLFTENGDAVVNTTSTYYSRTPITEVNTFMLDYFDPANGCTISIYKL